ncbi:MAG: hypothetical protein E6J09_02025 [Chloroflexi bacterium]|nr:MAG: hypothetical protein E6J09_02025 [Chloroflexota bacterium]
MTDAATRYLVSRRRFLRDATLTSIGLIAAACTPSTTGTPGGGGAGAKGGEFHGAWPYKLPPEYHYNYFATNSMLGDSIYRDLFIPTLGVYRWADAKWDYWLAQSASLSGDTYEIKLRSGLKWDDGKPFTAKDVATTYWVGRLASYAIWNFIDKIETPDDATVRFHYSKPTSLGERLILRNQIKPDSVYGALAKKAQDFYGGGGTNSTDAGKTLIKEMNDFRPSGPPSIGPYKIDVASLTAAQVSLVRNTGGLFGDKVNFDKILIYQGETAEVTPIVLNGDVDYATHGFPLAADKAFQDKGYRIIRGPQFTGPALYFHWENAPQFQDKRLRQAVAMAFNREEAGKIFYGSSARAPKYMAGFSDGLGQRRDLGEGREEARVRVLFSERFPGLGRSGHIRQRRTEQVGSQAHPTRRDPLNAASRHEQWQVPDRDEPMGHRQLPPAAVAGAAVPRVQYGLAGRRDEVPAQADLLRRRDQLRHGAGRRHRRVRHRQAEGPDHEAHARVQ